MTNNWVLLQGRLCHTPNYSSTKRGLHKVAFRLAIPRPQRSETGGQAVGSAKVENAAAVSLPPLSADSDFVTVIIIGVPAWEFKQLDLQMGAPVRVEGRLRSWDLAPEQLVPEQSESGDGSTFAHTPRLPRRSYYLEVIAEKVESLDVSGK